MKNIKREWVCTDPDTHQYGRQLSPTLFEFIELGIDITIIDLTEYENKEIEGIINSYGYTLMIGDDIEKGLTNINELYGNEASWIIAECLFENS